MGVGIPAFEGQTCPPTNFPTTSRGKPAPSQIFPLLRGANLPPHRLPQHPPTGGGAWGHTTPRMRAGPGELSSPFRPFRGGAGPSIRAHPYPGWTGTRIAPQSRGVRGHPHETQQWVPARKAPTGRTGPPMGTQHWVPGRPVAGARTPLKGRPTTPRRDRGLLPHPKTRRANNPGRVAGRGVTKHRPLPENPHPRGGLRHQGETRSVWPTPPPGRRPPPLVP